MHLSESSPEFEALLSYLKHNRGCDLTGYKRSTLIRRFEHRMQMLKIESYPNYLQHLKNNSEEYLALLDSVFINVTRFFRDCDTWHYLNSDILPKILKEKPLDEPIRIWSAGCATGQEVYSLLMLLAEALGIEACVQRVQYYATDVDKVALRQARSAIYSAIEVADVPADLLTKYFEKTDSHYEFHPQLRNCLIFGHHDLTKDAPISKVDLLLCRNVLIYFRPDTQAAILVRFHFALKATGFLLLGKAESVANSRRIFTPINWKQKIYAKGLNLGLDDMLSLTPKSHRKHPANGLNFQQQFWQIAFENSPIAQVAVNCKGYLVSANEKANHLFQLTVEDQYRPFIDLELGKLLGRYALMPTFYHHHQSITLQHLKWKTPEATKYLDTTITPVFDSQKRLLGITLAFVDATDMQGLKTSLEHAQTELARVSEALRVTTHILAAVSDELGASDPGNLFFEPYLGDRN